MRAFGQPRLHTSPMYKPRRRYNQPTCATPQHNPGTPREHCCLGCTARHNDMHAGWGTTRHARTMVSAPPTGLESSRAATACRRQKGQALTQPRLCFSTCVLIVGSSSNHDQHRGCTMCANHTIYALPLMPSAAKTGITGPASSGVSGDPLSRPARKAHLTEQSPSALTTLGMARLAGRHARHTACTLCTAYMDR